MAGELAAEWIKIPDGNGNLQKVWVRDSTARRDIAQLQSDIGSLVIPTKTSDLTNDSDFQTGTQVNNAIGAEVGLMIPYGYCTTAAATAAKTVTVSPAVTALETGLMIAVKFQYANTGTDPTLDVNSLGAKAIKRYGTTAAGTSAASNWNAKSVVLLMYDGTYWMLVDWNNTTYSGMTDAEYQAGTSTTNRLITPARLKAAILYHAPVDSVNGQTGAVTVNVPTKTSDLTNDSGFITSAPVTSVNGQTGAVTISVPTKTSDLTNDSGFLTSAPVASVNGQTGAVSLTASDVGALPSSTAIPSKTSDLTNDSGFITASAVPNPSSAAPAMDGTAAAGSSTDYARADHVHPSDTNKQDALTTAQLDAVNSGVTADFVTKKFATVTGTFASSATYTALQSYPDGFTQTNCIVLALEAQRNGLWRGGGNTYGTSQQTFVQLEANGFTVFNSQSAGFNQPYRVTFMRTDI